MRGEKSGNGAASLVSTTPSFSNGLLVENSPQLDRRRLSEWIREKSDPKCRPQCVVFLLSHDQGGERGMRPLTESEELPPKMAAADREAAVERIVREFDESSSSLAHTYPRTQRFEVGAFVPRSPEDDALPDHLRVKREEPRFIFSFLVTPPPDVASGFHQDPHESSAGQTATIGHLQRLLDRSFSQLSSNLQADKDRLLEEKRFVMEQNQALMQRGFENALKMEQLLDAKSLRDMTEQKERFRNELEFKLWSELLKYLAPVAGVVVKKIAGTVGADEPEHPMLSFAKSLRPDQLLDFVDSLDEGQRSAFVPMAQQVAMSMSDGQKEELARLTMERNAAKMAAAGGEEGGK